MDTWLKFVLAILATWRVTHLLALEDGPGNLIVHLRFSLNDSWVGKLMDCFLCLSLWIAIPLAFFVSKNPLEIVIIWIALSGAACLLERLGQEPVVIQELTDETEGGT